MSEFLNQIAAEAEAGNFDEVARLSKSFNYAFFNNSLFEQFTETAYFPSLNPDFSKKRNRKKSKDELKKQALERFTNDPALAVLAPLDYEAIKEITDYDFISLFEAALLIGYRVDNYPKMLVFSSPELFLDAILSKQIDPREPKTLIPFSKLHESPKIVEGEIFFTKETPDLSWKLSLKEVAEFAVTKGYPAHLFADLLTETSRQAPETASPYSSANDAESNDQESQAAPDIRPNNLGKTNIQTNPVGRTSNRRHEDAINSLLKIVLGMAIDAYGYDPSPSVKNKATGRKSGSIHAALERIDGLSTDDETIRKYLTEAAERNPTAKPHKP